MKVSRNAYFTTQYLEDRQYQQAPDAALILEVPRVLLGSRNLTPDVHMARHADELAEEITPAQLVQISTPKAESGGRRSRHLVDYIDYFRPRSPTKGSRGLARSSLFRWKKKDLDLASTAELDDGPFLGFYINQQKRLDLAKEVKPTMYTHKTFKDIFPKDDEQERLNPMDVVFRNNDETQGLKQKFAKALRSVQIKLGKDDYASYDYYQNLHDPSPVEAVPPRRSPFSLAKRDALHSEPMAFDSDDETVSVKSKAKSRGKLSRKLGLRKSTPTESVDTEPSAPQDSVAVRAPALSTTGPQEHFHPVWNYLLSWLVYTQSGSVASEPEEAEQGKIYPVDDDVAAPKHKSRALKGCRDLLQSWNQPVLEYHRKRSTAKTHDDLPSEYEVDISDGDEFEEQLRFNVQSRQLESVHVAGTSAAALTGLPETLISNLNRAIKQIRVMQVLFAPIDVVAASLPRLQTVVILLELFIFMWILYELSLLIDALCMAVKAVCAPMIAIGKFMNRIV